MLQCCTVGTAHSAVENAISQKQQRIQEGCMPWQSLNIEGPAAHLQEVAKLLSPRVLQMVVTLEPLKHVLQA